VINRFSEFKLWYRKFFYCFQLHKCTFSLVMSFIHYIRSSFTTCRALWCSSQRCRQAVCYIVPINSMFSGPTYYIFFVTIIHRHPLMCFLYCDFLLWISFIVTKLWISQYYVPNFGRYHRRTYKLQEHVIYYCGELHVSRTSSELVACYSHTFWGLSNIYNYIVFTIFYCENLWIPIRWSLKPLTDSSSQVVGKRAA